MCAEQQKPFVADPPPTFSLGTLFLVVTCISIACAAFRIAGNDGGFVLAALLVAGFLTVWFFVTGRRRAAECLFIAVLGLLLFTALIPGVGGRRGVSPRTECMNNIRQIGLALSNYEQAHSSFPPAFLADKTGKPLYSWRVLILPEMERREIYQTIHLDEPWDAPNNVVLSKLQWTVMHCPSDEPDWSHTSYLAVVGPNTAWPGAKGRKLADFKDPSKTILVVEVANSGINWAEPRDLYVRQMAPGVNSKIGQGISSLHLGGANAVFADGHVEFIPDDIDPKKLAAMLEINPPDHARK